MKYLIELLFSLHLAFRLLPRFYSPFFFSWIFSLIFLISYSHLLAEKNTAPDKAANDHFGSFVSQSGNILAVGAQTGDPDGLADAGAAYLFKLEDNGSTSLLTKITAPDKAANDHFGRSVSQSGNILAVGAYQADPDGLADAGAAYLFQLEVNGSASFLTKITAPDKAASDQFGISVSQSGNILAVGANYADPDSITNAGAAYLFQLEDNGSASFLTKITAPDKALDDRFGLSVSQSGNILAVGAYQADPDGLSEAGAAYLFQLEDNGSATYLTKVTAPDKAANDRFGSSVSQSGNILAVGASAADPDGLSEAGAAYLFQLEDNGSASFLTKITAPDKASDDYFGISVSQSGNILAVGAYAADPDGLAEAGAAYLFQLEDNGSASFLTKITAPDKASDDYFGISVSQSGNILAVGANYADPDSITDAGAAYTFDLSGLSEFKEKITAPDKAASDQFGYSVSQSGNILAVGAVTADPDGLADAGAAYLFQLEDNGSASFLTKITAPDKASDDYFGISVSQSGNILAVGANYADPDSITDAGAAYLFQLEDNGSASFLTKITAPDKASDDRFGTSVSQSGNILAVGAYAADPDGLAEAGAAYLFQLEDNGSASFLTKITAPDKASGDHFGSFVSQSGNILAVGAQTGDPDGLADAGAAYLFKLEDNGSTSLLTKITAPDKAANDHFGRSVSQSGNILAVGAYQADPDGLADAGAAYLFQLEVNGSASFLTKITAPDKAASDYFGYSVSQSGNILAVGAFAADPDGLASAGAAYLFQLEDNGSASFLTKITAPDKAASDYFGYSVSQSGNILAVGANYADPDSITNAGAAYTFDISAYASANTPPSNLNANGALAVQENEPIGTIVGEFNATDPDANSTLSYSLVAGAGDGNNSLFTLESNGTLKSAAILDYEAGATLSIRVKVQDENNASIDGNFTVLVTNQNEAPINLTPSGVFTLAENQAAGTAVGSFTATDPDAGATLSFSLVDDNATSSSKFSLSTGGALTTAEILDFENNASHNIRVLVSDEFNASVEGNFTVTVSNVEEVPIITFGGGAANATSNVSENQRGAASIAATEPDGQTLTYSIIGGVDAALFAIDASTGELSFVSNPDYEFPNDANQDNSYQVTIQVVDTANNIVSQSITVVVENMIDLSTAIFTNAGATGRYGPTQAQVNAAYTGTDLDGRVTINTQGIQEWTVPFSGIYSIEAWGARGGDTGSSFETKGGMGTKMKGEFSLTKGEVLRILVGQKGLGNRYDGGGGGGTFVVKNDSNSSNGFNELIISGGGGGSNSYNNGSQNGIDASTGNSGLLGTGGGYATPGSNGTGGSGSFSSSGGGLFTDGGNPSWNSYGGEGGGKSFINGGLGGLVNLQESAGGFGGGGASHGNHCIGGGGGGGYSGGTGSTMSCYSGGGGGSYNSGTNQLNLAGANSGHGKVIISALNTPPTDIALSNHSLPENLLANSQVGTFTTTDPDDSNGTGTYTYSLVAGVGDTNNALFNLDANGTLTILATSDYEQRLIDSNTTALLHTDLNASFLEGNYSADLYLTPQVQYPTWSIRVRTADDVNASYDEVILIASLDRDDTIPVITFDGNGTRTQTPWTYIPPPIYDASDNVDGNITNLVTTEGNLTTEQPGIYYLHHDVTDAAGNNATRITFALTVVNQNPTDLHLSNTFVEENLPVGTLVGIFTTTDPDDLNNTRAYSYELIIDPSKALPPFQLDTNGTLTTNSILDFESIESYSIRVRTTDQFGGTYEEDFVIYVVDAFPPYVETGNAILGADGRFTLYGTVVDEGGISGILERGFVISSMPITNLLDTGITRLISSVNDNNFTSVFSPLLSGKKHFYRAYAINAESDYLGTEKSFTPEAIPGPGYWSDAKQVSGAANWWESPWFGTYYSPSDNQWIMHSELGWLYPSPTRDFGIWFWKEELNWLWTNYETFPFLYSIDEGSWLYFYGKKSDQRLFYSYLAKKWIILTDGQLLDSNSSTPENPDNPDTGSEQDSTLNRGQE